MGGCVDGPHPKSLLTELRTELLPIIEPNVFFPIVGIEGFDQFNGFAARNFNASFW